MYHHESLKLYDEKNGKVLVGIKGRYLMKPRWYKINTTKGSQEEFINWKGKRVYMSEVAISEEYLQDRKDREINEFLNDKDAIKRLANFVKEV